MKKNMVLALLLVMSLFFAMTGCGGSSGTGSGAQSAETSGSGCAYDFPKTGFGFDLPEGLEITKGSVSVYDMGELTYNGHISLGWPIYLNCTEEEAEALTEDDLDKVRTGGSFLIICSGEGRDLEQTKADYLAQYEKETGTKPTKKGKAFLDEMKQIHQEGDYTWYMVMNEKSEDIPKEYQAEYDAFFDARDEIIRNMKFYEPQIPRGLDAGKDVSFVTTDLDGNTVDSGELFAENKITMINIWGTYCGPCINEMPKLEELSRDYADKGVAVVGLIIDVTESDDSMLPDARSIIKDTGVTYLNLKAWEGYNDQLATMAVPTTYFVDSNGKLVGEPVIGADVSEYRETLDQLIRK